MSTDKILVIGASGQVGKRLVKLLTSSGLSVRAMVRNAEQAPVLESMDAEVVVADLEGDFFHVLKGCNTVVFSAGSGGGTGAEKTLLVDAWGAAKAINHSVERKVARFIMISSRGADNPDHGPSSIKPYLVAKHIMDRYLEASGLNFTILRPGMLTNEPGSGLVRLLRPIDPQKQLISRDDVASTILYCINNPHTVGKTYELYKGTNKIEDALSGNV